MTRLALMLLLAAAAFAGELTGKWSGSFNGLLPDGTEEPGPAYMDLKVSGQTVTGTAGPDENTKNQITKGKLEGTKLTFQVVSGAGLTLTFDLTFDGERIKGTALGERDGQRRTAKVDLKRKQ